VMCESDGIFESLNHRVIINRINYKKYFSCVRNIQGRAELRPGSDEVLPVFDVP